MLIHKNETTGYLNGYPNVGYFGMVAVVLCLFLASKIKPAE
jgi:hypothetical protein